MPPAAEAGLILLPKWRPCEELQQGLKTGPDAWRKELLSFPRGSRDDRVDCASSAAAYFTAKAGNLMQTILELAKQ